MTRRLFLSLILSFAAGCTPRLSPPYRDYEVRTPPADLTEALAQAATSAGWRVVPGQEPDIVTTATRRVASGLASRTEAFVELVPLSGGFVRVMIRAEKRSTIFGGRSKVYTLDRGLREAVLSDLTDALRQRGLVPLGTPRDRDEDATE